MVASQNAGQSKPGANSPVRMSALRAASTSPLKQSATPSALQEYPLSGSSSVAFRAAAIASGIRPSDVSTCWEYMRKALASEGLDTGFTRRGAINVYETEKEFERGRREADAASDIRLKRARPAERESRPTRYAG